MRMDRSNGSRPWSLVPQRQQGVLCIATHAYLPDEPGGILHVGTNHLTVAAQPVLERIPASSRQVLANHSVSLVVLVTKNQPSILRDRDQPVFCIVGVICVLRVGIPDLHQTASRIVTVIDIEATSV